MSRLLILDDNATYRYVGLSTRKCSVLLSVGLFLRIKQVTFVYVSVGKFEQNP